MSIKTIKDAPDDKDIHDPSTPEEIKENTSSSLRIFCMAEILKQRFSTEKKKKRTVTINQVCKYMTGLIEESKQEMNTDG